LAATTALAQQYTPLAPSGSALARSDLEVAATVLGIWAEQCGLSDPRILITSHMIEIVNRDRAERVEVASYRSLGRGDVAAVASGMGAVGRHPEGAGEHATIEWHPQPDQLEGTALVMRRVADTLEIVGQTSRDGTFLPIDRRMIFVRCE
jgi:hypothetical protein